MVLIVYVKNFKKIMEQDEDYLDYNKNEEEAVVGKISNKQTETYFATMFEDIRHEPVILLLSLKHPNILNQSKFTDHGKKYFKKSCSRKIEQTEKIERICCCIFNRIVFLCLRNNDISQFE